MIGILLNYIIMEKIKMAIITWINLDKIKYFKEIFSSFKILFIWKIIQIPENDKKVIAKISFKYREIFKVCKKIICGN